MSQTSPGLPRYPLLRPGVRAARRDDGHLQVGIGADRVVLPDTPEMRRLLVTWGDGREPLPPGDEERRWCVRLLDAGLLADGETFWPALARHDMAATTAYAEDPVTADRRLATRAAGRVALDLPHRWRSLAVELCRDAGLALGGDTEPGAVRLQVRIGVTRRPETDLLMRSGEPHLLVASVEGRVQLGPFVEPGRTACLRCVDAHLTERDPRRGLVLEQYSETQTRRITPEPVDSALVTLALGWAVRDLVTYLDGGTPATWSASVELTPELDLTRTPWLRHPGCGCSWGDFLVAG